MNMLLKSNLEMFLQIFLLLLLSSIAVAQTTPNQTDSIAYSKAFSLVFDFEGRARQAEQILLDEGKKSLQDLNTRELVLLFRIHGEVFDFKKQLAVAKVLWEKESNSTVATECISSVMWANLSTSTTTPDSVIKFVDDSLEIGKGDKRILLVLKAIATLYKNDGISETEKKGQITDLFLQANKEPRSPSEGLILPGDSIESFVHSNPAFLKLFSNAERDALVLRLRTHGGLPKKRQGENN